MLSKEGSGAAIPTNIYITSNALNGDTPILLSQVFNEGFDSNYYPSMLS